MNRNIIMLLLIIHVWIVLYQVISYMTHTNITLASYISYSKQKPLRVA